MASKKQTRRALFMSIVSLILCCAMLVGTTFAWFTDEVTSGINQITAGNLDVELYHSDNEIKEEKVDSTTVLFDDIELWEPGAVVYENFKIVNEGNLALKYQLALNFANATKNENGRTLADVLKVAVVDDGFSGDREEAKKLSYANDLSTFAISGNLMEGQASKTYGVVIYWEPGDNDNDYNMNNLREEVLTIDLGVELFATQVENENDSFDNTYDKDASLEMPEIRVETPTADALLAALAAGETAVLTADTELKLDEDLIIPKGLTSAIDLGGNTLTISGNGSIMAEGNLIIDNGELNGSAGASGTLTAAIVVNDGAIVELRDDVTINVLQGGLGVLALGGTLVVDGSAVNVADGGTGIFTTGYMGAVCDADIIIKSGSVNGDGTAINIGTASDLNIEIGASANVGKIIGGYGGTSAVITYYGDTAPDVADDAAAELVIRKAVAEGVYVDTTKANHYTIESKAGLMNLNALLASVVPGEGNIITVDLMVDVDLAGEKWAPIESMWVVFNGNNHTIKNVNAGMASDGRRSGFWAYAGAVTINDLILENVTVSGSQAGTFVGSAEGAKINNCYLKGSNTVNYVAGIEDWPGIGAVSGIVTNSNINVTIESGATVTLNKNAMSTPATFIDNLTGYLNANDGTVVNNGTVVVNQGVSTAEELTAAVNNATDGSTIYFLNDINGDATVLQKRDVSIVIDGKDYKYDGIIYVQGGQLGDGPETLTIQNVNFTTSTEKGEFINCNSSQVGERYAHNLTVQNCTFTTSVSDVVALRLRQTYNITMKDCKVKGLHSAIWATGGMEGIVVDNLTANTTNGGVSFGNSKDVVLKNSNISVTGKYSYGVRVDASVATTLNVIDSTIKADAPILLRKATSDYVAIINETKLNATGKEEIIITASDYEEGKELTAPTGNITVTVIATEADGIAYATDYLNSAERTLYDVPADYTQKELVVAEGVTAIGNFAFSDNKNVETVILPSTVEDLGRGFDSNTSIKKVVLNEGLETISSRAFKATTALEEVTISSTVKTLEDDAFQKTGLKNITIPASVNYIGVQAFGASKIESVTIEGTVTINNKAFRGCANLRTVTINGEDINFINENSGSGDCWFCNSESNNKNASDIDFYVKNNTVAAKIYTAMGAEMQGENVKIYVNGVLYEG